MTAPATESAAIAADSVEDRPPAPRMVVLGFQHVVVMYTGCVTVPLVFGAAAHLPTTTIGSLVNADLVVAGLMTIIQSFGIARILGVRLPVVAGASFTAVTPMTLIAAQYGVQAVYGAMLASGIFGLLIAVPFARLVRFIAPVVRGTAITVIGLSLIGTAAGLVVGGDSKAADYAAPSQLGLAAAIVVVVLLITRFARGFLAQTAVLVGLVLGVGSAALAGMTDFSAVGGASWFGLPDPFRFGAPAFPVPAVISMCIVMLVIFTESTTYMLSVADMSGRQLSRAELTRGLATDGLSGVLGGVLTSFPDTVFAQNVSLVRMSGVRSRHVATTAGVILVLLGLIPKLGEVIASIPGPVIGAVSLVMFAMVAGVGIRTLGQVNYDGQGNHNMMVVALSLAAGMLPVVVPDIYHRFPTWFQIIAGGAISSAVLTAFVLNLFFNHFRRKTRAA
jgi:NCS2 family nucleobase:cation symporter-2